MKHLMAKYVIEKLIFSPREISFPRNINCELNCELKYLRNPNILQFAKIYTREVKYFKVIGGFVQF